MSKIASHNFQVVLGDDFIRIFRWRDINGDLIDVSDYDIEFYLRINNVITTYTTAPQVSIISDTDIRIHIAGTVTTNWSGNAEWKLRVVSPTNVKSTLALGNIEVIR